MEFEIEDEPQGLEHPDSATRDGGLIEDPVALGSPENETNAEENEGLHLPRAETMQLA